MDKIGILMAVTGVKWDEKGPTGISTYKYFPKTPSGSLKLSFYSTIFNKSLLLYETTNVESHSIHIYTCVNTDFVYL